MNIGYHKILEQLCILKPTLGKQYLKYPFSNLSRIAVKTISEASELFLIGYSLPLYDTLSEFFILSTNSNCKITIINLGEESHKLRERIVNDREIEWDQVTVHDKGLKEWMNG